MQPLETDTESLLHLYEAVLHLLAWLFAVSGSLLTLVQVLLLTLESLSGAPKPNTHASKLLDALGPRPP